MRFKDVLAPVSGVAALLAGEVEVLASSTEIGQGAHTVFTRIATTALRLSPDRIVITRPDTAWVPDSGPTVASRTVKVVGKLGERTCRGLLQQLADAGLLAKDTLTVADFQETALASLELLCKNPRPNDTQIREGLAESLCRCTGYTKAFDAVREASIEIDGGNA